MRSSGLVALEGKSEIEQGRSGKSAGSHDLAAMRSCEGCKGRHGGGEAVGGVRAET